MSNPDAPPTPSVITEKLSPGDKQSVDEDNAPMMEDQRLQEELNNQLEEDNRAHASKRLRRRTFEIPIRCGNESAHQVGSSNAASLHATSAIGDVSMEIQPLGASAAVIPDCGDFFDGRSSEISEGEEDDVGTSEPYSSDSDAPNGFHGETPPPTPRSEGFGLDSMRSELDAVESRLTGDSIPPSWPLVENPVVFSFNPVDFKGRNMHKWGELDWTTEYSMAKRLLFFMLCTAISLPIREHRKYKQKRENAVDRKTSSLRKKLDNLVRPDLRLACAEKIAQLEDGEYYDDIDQDPEINPLGFDPGQPVGCFYTPSCGYIPNMSIRLEQVVSSQSDDVPLEVRLWVYTHNPRFKLGTLIQHVIIENYVMHEAAEKRGSDPARRIKNAKMRMRTPNCHKEITSLEAWCFRIIAPIFGKEQISSALGSRMRDINTMRLENPLNPANPLVWFDYAVTIPRSATRRGGDSEFTIKKSQATAIAYNATPDATRGVQWKWPMPEFVSQLEPSQMTRAAMSEYGVLKFNPMLEALLTHYACENTLTPEQRKLMGLNFDEDPQVKAGLITFAQQLLNRRAPLGELGIQIQDSWNYQRVSRTVREALGKDVETKIIFPTIGEVASSIGLAVTDVPLQYLHIFAERNRLMQYNLKCTPRRVCLKQSAEVKRDEYMKYRTNLIYDAFADERFNRLSEALVEQVELLSLYTSERNRAREFKKTFDEETAQVSEETRQNVMLAKSVTSKDILAVVTEIEDRMKTSCPDDAEDDSSMPSVKGKERAGSRRSTRPKDILQDGRDMCLPLMDIINMVTFKSDEYIDLQRACENKQDYQIQMVRQIWREMKRAPLDAPVGSMLEATDECPWSYPTVRGVRWFNGLPVEKRFQAVNRISENLDPYAEMRATKNISFSKFLRLMPGPPAYDVWKLQLIRHTAGHAFFGLKPNILFVGRAAVGKSFRAQKMAETSFPGSIHRPSHTTANAANVDGDPTRDCLTLIEETEPHMLGMDKYGTVLPGGTETVKHQLAAGFTVTHSCHVDSENGGKRVMTIHVSCTNGTMVCLTNMGNPPLDNPVINRFLVEHIINEIRDRRYQIRDIAGHKACEMNEQEKDEFLHLEQLHHWYSYLTDKFIEGGALEDVRTDEAVDMIRLIIRELETKHSIPKVRVRYFSMFVQLVRAATVMSAVWTELFTEHGWSKHGWDAEANKPKDFDPAVYVTHILPRLYAGIHQVVDVLTLFAPSFMPNRTFEVLVACRELWDKNRGRYTYRKVFKTDMNGQRKVETDERYIAFNAKQYEAFYHSIARVSKGMLASETVKVEIMGLQREHIDNCVYDEVTMDATTEEIECVILDHDIESGEPQIAIATKMLTNASEELAKVNGALKQAITAVLCHQYAEDKDVLINSPFVCNFRKKGPETFFKVLDVIHLKRGPRSLCIENPLATSAVDRMATVSYTGFADWHNRIEMKRMQEEASVGGTEFGSSATGPSSNRAGEALDEMKRELGANSGIPSVGIFAQRAPVLHVTTDFDDHANIERLVDIQFPGDHGLVQHRFHPTMDRKRCLRERETNTELNAFFKATGMVPFYPEYAALTEAQIWDINEQQHTEEQIQVRTDWFKQTKGIAAEGRIEYPAVEIHSNRITRDIENASDLSAQSKIDMKSMVARKRQFNYSLASVRDGNLQDYCWKKREIYSHAAEGHEITRRIIPKSEKLHKRIKGLSFCDTENGGDDERHCDYVASMSSYIDSRRSESREESPPVPPTEGRANPWNSSSFNPSGCSMAARRRKYQETNPTGPVDVEGDSSEGASDNDEGPMSE